MATTEINRTHPATDETLQEVAASLRNINHTLAGDRPGTVYGFRVDSTEQDASACVTYLADARGMQPAFMDYAHGRFNYGSWWDAFFMPRPCMLKYDGTVDYYLDPDDYSKRADGTPSDVADPTYAGNAMMEWGRDNKIIWYKVVPDSDDPTSASVYVADYPADSGYVCWPFVNADGHICRHFYTPCYFGTIVNDGSKDVLRSLSGQSGASRCKDRTAAVERTMAKANNPAGLDLWDTERYCDVVLVELLLTLLAKSLDSQTAYGQGLHTSGSDAVNDAFVNGQHDARGLFWGTSSGAAATPANAVKVFGMENWWGFMWRRMVGLVNDKGIMRYKLTKGPQDGSAVSDYAVSTESSAYAGYLAGDALPAASGASVQKMAWKADGAHTPTVAAGDSAHGYCDGLWTNNGQVDYAYHGGNSNDSLRVGAWYLNLNAAASIARWHIGASPSCKPQS